MIRSILSYSSLSLGLRMEELKTTSYILNRVLSKLLPKTPYELWTSRKPTLNYLHIWVVELKLEYLILDRKSWMGKSLAAILFATLRDRRVSDSFVWVDRPSL
jgi:hypothetical protein